MTNEMTAEEASVIIGNIPIEGDDCYTIAEYQEAKARAIQALEAQPNRCDSCTHSEEQDGSNCYECVKGMADNFEAQQTDAVSRGEALKQIDAILKQYHDMGMNTAEIIVSHTRDIIEKLPSIIPCDAREAYLKGYDYGVKDWFKSKTQPCDDCISRASLIDKAMSWDTHFTDSERYVSLSDIMALPSVTPQRPKGKWIKVYPLGMDYEAYMCSECKTGDWDITIGEYKFCPYCGAEMSGGGEDDEAM